MIKIAPLDSTLGAQITGVDLAKMNVLEWKKIEDAFHEYAALVFPEQHLDSDAHIAFAVRFGDIEYLVTDQKSVPISNQNTDGSIMAPKEKRYQTLRGNEGWHTDSSYMPLAAKASALAGIKVPNEGGETELADMRAAYDVLDDKLKKLIADLSAYHSLYVSKAKAGYEFRTGEGYGYHTKGAPLRPLVKIHPVTGRKSLFIGRHTYSIPGMKDKEAQELLDELLDKACRPPRIYTHHWKPGDLMIWDNRCVLHRARPYDYQKARVMRHVRIAGDYPSELAITGPDGKADSFEPSSINSPSAITTIS